MKSRVNTLKGFFEREKLDGYIIADDTNILYFTGFLGGARVLVPREGENVLYVYGVNYEEAKETARDCKVELVKTGEDADKKVADEVEVLKLGRVGFDTLSASVYLELAKALKGVELKAKGKLVWELRSVKDETELRHMRRAAELTGEGMKAAFEVVRPGLREHEVAAEIEYAMRRLGSWGIAFDTIVASGVRSAYPHGGCTDRKIRKGDLVVLDIGAKYQNYRVDLTRTVTVGRPSSKQARIHEVLREAQERAFQSIRAGVKASDVDAVARGLIEGERYGEYFVHSLGHGIGLDIHEPPTLRPGSKDKLSVGNVVTVEPGIYIVKFGGVRIEDTVLVQEGGAEKLTKVSYVLSVR
ncbi:MAG: Xaa-Pro peptidase family protein [Candidatus Bathyarchaeota archaeon]|nr:Xaa-Pro peptidase family protein [Candidatus Bathyarchaeota archaeon]